jgi:hypothetical protein
LDHKGKRIEIIDLKRKELEKTFHKEQNFIGDGT